MTSHCHETGWIKVWCSSTIHHW